MGVFVQVNESSPQAARHPVGYVIQENGCWEWVGSMGMTGYGHWRHGNTGLAHRAVYQSIKGPIPNGLTLDHLCRNRKCVNPDHLEPVTIKQNVLRGTSFAAKNATKTHCPKGHPLTAGKSQRLCRTCNNASWRRWANRGSSST